MAEEVEKPKNDKSKQNAFKHVYQKTKNIFAH